MTKNPFEVRLDVVQMAQKLLSDKALAKRLKHETALSGEEHLPNITRNLHLEGIANSSYTSEEIITEAEKLYAFVNKRG